MTTKPIDARVLVPGSKSMTNRALLLAALSQGQSTLSNILFSDDTFIFIEALEDLGVSMTLDEERKQAVVQGVGNRFPVDNIDIDCGDAGTAARFLLAACSTHTGVYRFAGVNF